ncbi:hypothetical protein SAMN02799624_03148 [Paenibacillus sp. UNC496MF]|uniref:hypothetical protein n=1 Tax=Paenibacillus sp. UNC496MF TaxID=1502753 RepID=UPI0008EA23AE|nr:hypothetical protein [Paenibacillus sp. UNC496MF]SFJ04334.1 hypothetical protein SAMN02799624_03148 [Paenibacillus sp. UNC496MF]
MKGNRADFPTYYNGYTGDGAAMRRLAEELAAGAGGRRAEPFEERLIESASNRANADRRPGYYDGSGGSGDYWR